MRDLLKLDIIIVDGDILELKPLPVNGIQAEIRLSSNPEQLQTLKLLVHSIKSILDKFDNLYRDFLSGKVITYLMIQRVLENFDTPDIQGAQINEDFLLDLTQELHKRLGRIEALIPELVLTNPINPKGLVIGVEDLIKLEFLIGNRLIEVENKLKDKIENWRQGDKKIECAAFCELLHDMNYFIDKKSNRKGPIKFAQIRYGIDITVQMESSKKEDRATHKVKLKRFFK
jgi:hypothetical protein